MGDGVHFLSGPKPREARLLLVILGADLHEGPEAAHAHAHRLAALGVSAEIARLSDLLPAHRFFGVIDQLDEGLPELVEQRHPFHLARRDGVERILHPRGEVVIDVRREVLGQEAAHDLADVRRGEAAALDVDVLAVAQRRDDRCVGRGAADAVFLERLHQRGLREARRRLREMLGRGHAHELDLVALRHRRQYVIRVVLHDIVHALLVHRNVAGFDQRRTVGAQHGALRAVGGARRATAGQELHRHGVEDGGRHLARDGALPDERVEPELVGFQFLFDIRGHDAGVGRPDRLVRLLRALRLGAIDPRLFGESLLAVEPDDDLADLPDRFLREIDRVGAHVRDQADLALADVHALVQLLRHAHGLLSAETELAGGFLLQGRGGEGRSGIPAPLFSVDGEHGELAAGGLVERAHRLVRGTLRGEAELLDLRAPVLDQLGGKLLLGVLELGIDGPVFARHERRDLILALADHPQRGALHPSRGQPRTHLLPEQRRQIEPDQKVEGAARLLGVHEVDRQASRLGHRFAHGILGDLVEHHALHLFAVEGPVRLQKLMQVPGNRLALAIGVGREVQGIGLLEGTHDGVDVLLIALDHLVFHREVMLRVDGAFLGHQIPNMTVRGENFEVLAEVFLDGFRLGRRFHDYEV